MYIKFLFSLFCGGVSALGRKSFDQKLKDFHDTYGDPSKTPNPYREKLEEMKKDPMYAPYIK